MVQKGINTTIMDAKHKLVEVINEALQSGIPVATVDIMLDVVCAEVKTVLQAQLKAEEDSLKASMTSDITQPSNSTEE